MGERSRNNLPLRILEKCLKEPISVKLKDGSEYTGRLQRSDISMNLILAEAKEVNENNEVVANYGNLFIRGSNIVYILVKSETLNLI